MKSIEMPKHGTGDLAMNEDLVKRLRQVEEMLKIAQFNEAKNLIAEAADAIEDLQKQLPSWTSVTERLPDEDGRYLTLCPLIERPPILWTSICYFAKDLYSVSKYDFADRKDKSGFYHNDSEYGYYEASGITHWMPLPEPPKEEH